MEKVRGTFEKWGFGAIAVPAMLPPPVPMVPFLIAAGAAQYPLKKFFAALFLGRAVRYSVLAILAALYGKQILSLLSQHAHVVAWTAAPLALIGIGLALLRWKIHSNHQQSAEASENSAPEEVAKRGSSRPVAAHTVDTGARRR
jgi:membrane protein DedA with SNARE-associated domain